MVDGSTTTFTWSITAYGPGGSPIAEVKTTNEFDLDFDGWTRSDGDVGKCDRSFEINPGVAESCNDVDDDCNGRVDDGLSVLICGCEWGCKDGRMGWVGSHFPGSYCWISGCGPF